MPVFKVALLLLALPALYLSVIYAELNIDAGGRSLFDLLSQRKTITNRFDGYQPRDGAGSTGAAVFGSCDFQEIFAEDEWLRLGLSASASITDSQTPLNSFFLLRSRLRQGLRPQVIVYFLDQDDFHFSGLFNYYLFAQHQKPDRNLLEQALAFLDFRTLNYLTARWIEESLPVRKFPARPASSPDAEDGNGPTRIPDPRERRANRKTQMHYLARIAALANEERIPLLLVLTALRSSPDPELKSFVNRLTGEHGFEVLEAPSSATPHELNRLAAALALHKAQSRGDARR